jgi:hypothetical protein
MHGYINKALKKYQHPMPTAPKDAPYAVAPIQYGTMVQQVDIDTTYPLSPTELKRVQDIVGTLLYYARAVNPTLLATLSTITAQQSNSTQAMAMHVTNYSTTLQPIPKQAYETMLVT